MAQEHFFNAASKPILELIERAGEKAGFGRGRAFEDFLTLLRCELAAKTMEEEYLETVHKGYEKGKPGDRGIDIMVQAGGRLIAEMAKCGDDILGDIFTGGISYGERGQFFTPDPVCELMVQLVSPGEDQGSGCKTEAGPGTVNDPACGSGRFLLAMAKKNPHAEFTGQDVDHRCAQMTAVNLGLSGLRGWAVWQNTLTLECHRVYRIGLFSNGDHRGVIRDVPVAQSSFNFAAIGEGDAVDPQKTLAQTIKPERPASGEPEPYDRPDPQQLDLF